MHKKFSSGHSIVTGYRIHKTLNNFRASRLKTRVSSHTFLFIVHHVPAAN